MVKTFLKSVRAAAAATSLAFVAMVGSVGFAGAVTSDATNSAVTFDPATATPVTVSFTDSNLASDTNFQVGFRTNGTTYSIGLVEYSWNNSTWNTLVSSFGTIGASPAYAKSGVKTLAASGVTTLYLRYTIPAGVDYKKVTQVNLLANNNGSTSSGSLDDTLDNGFVSLTRRNTAIDAPVVPEPTTFAIASIGLGMAGAARLRKRLAAKKA
ncbi:MAG: PEP-CTERM sorting domain-containing protein [Planctomycetota bacterium]